MTTETLVKSYHEDSKGLSPIDNQLALENREYYDNAFSYAKKLRSEHRKPDVDRSRSMGREIIELIDDIKAGHEVKRAEKVAKAHFKQNASAYQEQAVKDAAAKGVHTDFGSERLLEERDKWYQEDLAKRIKQDHKQERKAKGGTVRILVRDLRAPRPTYKERAEYRARISSKNK